MFFSILGPLEVCSDDATPLRIAGDRRRTLMLRLLLAPNHVVSFDKLEEDVWGSSLRRGTRSPLAAHISLLRDQLGADRIRTEATGYALNVDTGALDATLFELELAEAHSASSDGNHAASVHTLEGALARWRGDAFHDAREQAWAIGSAARLEELRCSAQELLLMGRLALGGHHDVVAAATAAVDAHPLRETRWAVLMLALYRSSRQAEALRAYQRLVRLLGDELGISPSSGLASLEEAIVLQKPDLDWVPDGTGIDITTSLLNVSTYGHPRHASAVTLPPARRPELESVSERPLDPISNTSFIGREEELVWLSEHVSKGCLITLTGPAGVGKTRLAMQVTHQCHRARGTEVRVVDLSAAQREDDVLETIAAALDISIASGFAIEEIVAGALSGREVLLVLDDCGSVRARCALVAAGLLADCSELSILATCREALDISDECVYHVVPLTLPAHDQATLSIDDLLDSSEAVRLFTERALDHVPSFTLDQSTAPPVVAICEELDGVPLALELAAAQLTHMSVFDLAQRLDDQLNLLSAKDPGIPSHVRSLRGSIDRSYEALSPEQTALLHSISVFVGTWSLTDVERLAAVLGSRRFAVDEVLGELVNKNLVQIERSGGRYRYRLLSSIKRYAYEKLVAQGLERLDAARGAHAYSCLRAGEDLESDADPRGMEAVDSFYPNFKIAFQYLCESDRLTDALRLVTSLRSYWPARVVDGIAMIQEVLKGDPALLGEECSLGYLVLGELLYMDGNQAASNVLLRGLALARDGDHDAMASDILSSLSAIEAFRGEANRAQAFAAESLDAAQRTEDRRLLAKAYASSGMASVRVDTTHAYACYTRALELYTVLEQRWGMSDCLANLGLLDLCLHEPVEATLRLEEAHRLSVEGGYSSLQCWVSVYSGFAALFEKDLERSEAELRRGLASAMTRGFPYVVVHGLAGIAAVIAERNQFERAATILGAVDALRTRTNESWHPVEDLVVKRARKALHAGLEGRSLSRASLKGAMLSLSDTAALALDPSEI